MLAATFLWVIFGLKGCHNISVVTKKAGDQSFIEEVSAIPGGEGVRLCVQCGSCAAACPSGAIVSRHFTTEQIIAQVEGALV